ncbi:MAG: hypothetical protein U0M06_14605 [Clostridia bacterium]|nr:hypothetical protein [Clostridia bacterium]
MGFGLLFFGYAAAYLMSLNSFGFLFKLVGSAVMLRGLSKLSSFEKGFRYAYILGIPMALCEIAEAAVYIFGASVKTDLVQAYADRGFWIFSVLFHIAIYYAVSRLSREVDILSITKRSFLGGVFLAAEVLLIVLTFILGSQYKLAWSFLIASVILGFVLVVYDLVLFYSCYKNICEEGYEESPVRYSRIPFLNKLLESAEKRDNEIYEKTKAYAENKIRQDNEKKKDKNKKKKRR